MISTSPAILATNRSTLWLERSVLVSALMACALALSQNLADPDFWGHVQYGRDALDDGLPSTATYTYTAAGYHWVNHENMAECLMAMGVRTPGPGGMVVIQVLLGLGVVLWMYRQARQQGVAQTPLYFCLLLAALNLMPSWNLRPQLMTYALFTLTIALVDWCFADWPTPWKALLGRQSTDAAHDIDLAARRRRLRWLWLLVPTTIIWANSHGGFVAGYCIMAVYLGGRSCEALIRYRRRGLPILTLCTMIVIACGSATLVNPYGMGLHRWLLRVLGSPWREIVEWNPPELWSLIGLFWTTMVVVSLAAVVFTGRPRDLVQLAVLGATMWQACEHRRHIAFYAILFGFWMPVHVSSLFSRFRHARAGDSQAARFSPRADWALVGLLLVGIGLMSCKLFTRFQGIPVERSSYPVSAFQYITDQDLHGNLLVRFRWAQYAIAAFGPPSTARPQLKVAFDGRLDTCYPQEVVDMYFDFAIGNAPPELRHRSPQSPPVDGSRILAYKHPNLVLIDRAQKYAVTVMQQHADQWTLLYQDAVAQLWGRRDMYDEPQHADYLPPAERIIGEAEQTGAVPWPALPQRKAASNQVVNVTRS